jgi:hypothetical protein
MEIKLPSIIEGLVDAGIEVTLKKDEEGKLAFVVDFFGDRGQMKFYPVEDPSDSWAELRSVDRYGDEDLHPDLTSVVRDFILAQESNSERNGGRSASTVPDLGSGWRELAIGLGLIEAQEVTTVTYRRL